MIQIKSGVQGVVNRKKWEARGAVLVAKLKATKAVWFPPEAQSAGKDAGRTTKKAASRTTKKTTGTAKRSAGAAKKATTPRKKT